MKRLIFFFTVCFLAVTCFSTCDDEDNFDDCYCSEEAVIIGIDYRECACCGGWFIEIDNDTLRAIDLPTDFQLSLGVDEYPLPVYLEWNPMENPCLGDEINVECIRRKE